MKYIKYLKRYHTLENKNIIVTGANSGLGLEVSRYLLFLKANLIMACRNEEKANKIKNQLLNEFPNSHIEVIKYDQASLSSIENFVNFIKDKKIDGLICNAGVYYPKKDMKTVDGFELTVGTNFIGTHYLLELLDKKLTNEQTKVVIVNSLTAINSKLYSLKDQYKLSRNKLYGFSKLLLSIEASERIQANHYQLVLAHPGVCSTNILSSKDTGLSSRFALAGRRFLNIFMHSASKAALSILEALLGEGKKYVKPRGLFAISGYPCRRRIPHKFNHQIIEETNIFIKESR